MSMYQLDPKAAREAEQFGKYLIDTGKYTGRFTRAEKLISAQKNSHGIGFTFETDDGKQCRFDVWTMSAAGEKFLGWQLVNAIMACLRVRALSEQAAQIDRYDWESKQTVKAQGTVFPELMGRPIGLVLVKTEYEKFKDGHPSGETAWKLEPLLPFDAAGEFTAAEILDQKTRPERLPQVVASLADRPLRKRPAPSAATQGHSAASAPPQSAPLDDYADIPF